ncbi:hypothetical protein Dsin_030509 [Dipteronia sinensis]|uniref:HAT C-terminal dimerisation domain-containing protein n=1 Tax=Dipteronia sinensis TaxID=43782 RepID=A0AAD9ZK71_9ROSI|nr:hypothetical protein Dsin_030509 [Dipteronia sinensis]
MPNRSFCLNTGVNHIKTLNQKEKHATVETTRHPTDEEKYMRILTDNQESSSSSSQHCELNTFCEIKFDIAHQGDFQEFDLLLWWKNHTESYLMLSQQAQDELVIPVSTVCSEHAFNIN